MPRAVYAIRVAGEVPASLLENFEGVTLIAQSLNTTLRADLVDPAALHGLLNALRDVGLVLVDVQRETEADNPSEVET